MTAISKCEKGASSNYKWLIFAILALGYMLVYFHRLSPAVMAIELMESFGVGAAITGILSSAYFYPYAIMQLPAGLLCDSLGSRKTVSIFLTIASAGAILFGLSPGVGVAIFARILVGLGVCMVFVPTLKVVSLWFSRDRFSMMTAILNAIGGIGVLAAAAPLALLTDRLGWRMTFVAIGATTMLLAGAVWVWVRNRPEDIGLPPVDSVNNAPGSPAANDPIPLFEGMKMVLGNRHFWAVAIWFFCTCGIFFGVGGLWGGPYLMQVYGLSKAQAGGVLNMIAAGMILGSPMLSVLSDRILKSRKKVLLISSLAILGTMFITMLFTDGLPLIALYAVFLFIGTFAAAVVVIAFTTTKELFPVEIAGTSVGAINLFPFAGGAVFQPVLGQILERFTDAEGYSVEGYRAVFIACFLAAVVALAAIAFMKETFSPPATEARDF
jgi:sugar phosphate permease